MKILETKYEKRMVSLFMIAGLPSGSTHPNGAALIFLATLALVAHSFGACCHAAPLLQRRLPQTRQDEDLLSLEYEFLTFPFQALEDTVVTSIAWSHFLRKTCCQAINQSFSAARIICKSKAQTRNCTVAYSI